MGIRTYLNKSVKVNKTLNSMNYDKQRIIRRLINKHGEFNVHKMAHDININVWQKTPKQIKKSIVLLKQLQNKDLDNWGNFNDNPIPDHYDSRIKKFQMH